LLGSTTIPCHARSEQRAEELRREFSNAKIAVGDVSSIQGTRDVAEQANTFGPYSAVIHNVAVGYQEPRRQQTEDGLPHVFAVNVLAPYILTALIDRPERLVYLSSGLHRSVRSRLDDLLWMERRWDGTKAYSESKLYDVVLAFAIARRWKGVFSNALEPGWVATKMGGPAATDDLSQGHLTQAWLATTDEADARINGEYFFHLRRREANPDAYVETEQDKLLAACEEISGIGLPD
jgi:NAD(P)-dependent dehydrogenase (short-subunit alcohol dehydrogenase family)